MFVIYKFSYDDVYREVRSLTLGVSLRVVGWCPEM